MFCGVKNEASGGKTGIYCHSNGFAWINEKGETGGCGYVCGYVVEDVVGEVELGEVGVGVVGGLGGPVDGYVCAYLEEVGACWGKGG